MIGNDHTERGQTPFARPAAARKRGSRSAYVMRFSWLRGSDSAVLGDLGQRPWVVVISFPLQVTESLVPPRKLEMILSLQQYWQGGS